MAGVLASAAAFLLVTAQLAAADRIIYTPESEEEANKYTLPEDFLFGVGTSAYQTEGAWNVSGKGVNVFDQYNNIDGHKPDPLQNGNIAADMYHHVDEDINIIKQLKLQIYRFSISWTRILPDGDVSKPNADGVRYYNEIIDKLKRINVEPLITLYHFDHPQALHEQHDSWLGRGMIEDFAKYADFAFEAFGDRVKYWTTMNEPITYCHLVYEIGRMVPGNASEPLGTYYTCIHNLLLAHGRAYRIYQRKYAAAQKGLIGLSALSYGARPVDSTSSADVMIAEFVNMMALGYCFDPLIFGDYPDMLITYVEQQSKMKGLPTSMLPKFTDDEKTMLTNSIDFLGLNVYMSINASGEMSGDLTHGAEAVARSFRSGKGGKDASQDGGFSAGSAEETPGGLGFSFECTAMAPFAMEASLSYVVNHFGKIPVIITENGCEESEGMRDQNRAAYHSGYLRSMIKAIKDFGANVLAMTAWTLVDDFEWSRAYTPKMGLVHIDFTSPERTRTLKDSSEFFEKLMTDRKVPLVNLRSEVTTVRPNNPTSQTEAPSPAYTSSQPTSGSSRSACTAHVIATTLFLLKLAF